jgi:hypothetical protein
MNQVSAPVRVRLAVADEESDTDDDNAILIQVYERLALTKFSN